MKESPKREVKVSMNVPGVAVRPERPANETPTDLHLDKDSVALFAGIHASKEFTAEAAHRAFVGVKRNK